MGTPFDWKIDDIERKANAAAPSHEVSALREYVARLERAIGEVSAVADGLRTRLDAAEDRIRIAEDRILEIMPQLN